MLRLLLFSAIAILAMLATSGCNADPTSASGANVNGGSPPNNAPVSESSGTTASALPSRAESVPGQPAANVGGASNPGSSSGQTGKPPGADSPPPAAPQPASWLNYTSQQFNFTIAYPDVYAVADGGNLPQDVPNLVHRVRFMDKALANSPTANLQPPQFMIDVFENKDALVLEDWIAANERRATLAETTIGNASGYVVSLQTMQAPNQFYFVAHGQYILRLIPLGPHSEQMLQSFKTG